jgi:hypothetical protein
VLVHDQTARWNAASPLFFGLVLLGRVLGSNSESGGGNRFTGTVPASFSSLTKVEYMCAAVP